MRLLLFALICLIFSIQFSYGQYWAGWDTNQCYGRFERYNDCVTACPDTCDDILRPNPFKICTLICRSGCECIPPYVRSYGYFMSRCVHPIECRFIY